MPKLQQKVAQMREQRLFEIALVRLRPQAQKVEYVGILQRLLGEIRGGIRQGLRKVRHRLTLALIEAGVDLVREHIAAPAVQNSLA